MAALRQLPLGVSSLRCGPPRSQPQFSSAWGSVIIRTPAPDLGGWRLTMARGSAGLSQLLSPAGRCSAGLGHPKARPERHPNRPASSGAGTPVFAMVLERTVSQVLLVGLRRSSDLAR